MSRTVYAGKVNNGQEVTRVLLFAENDDEALIKAHEKFNRNLGLCVSKEEIEVWPFSVSQLLAK